MGFLPGESKDAAGKAAILRLSVEKPKVAVPVIELFLK
jgi:hypothetical protein